jgi:hypothetical protein
MILRRWTGSWSCQHASPRLRRSYTDTAGRDRDRADFLLAHRGAYFYFIGSNAGSNGPNAKNVKSIFMTLNLNEPVATLARRVRGYFIFTYRHSFRPWSCWGASYISRANPSLHEPPLKDQPQLPARFVIASQFWPSHSDGLSADEIGDAHKTEGPQSTRPYPNVSRQMTFVT